MSDYSYRGECISKALNKPGVQEQRAKTIEQNCSKVTRICTVCGEEFTPRHHNQKICDKVHYFPCPVCGNPVEYKNNNKERTCSRECSRKKRAQTNLDRYGTVAPCQNEDILKKRTKTNIERYGGSSPMNSEEVRIRYVENCIENHGVDNPAKLNSVKEKKRKTNLSRYGTETPFSSEEVKSKIRETNINKYGVDNPMKSDEVKKKLERTCMSKYGVRSTTLVPEIREKQKRTTQERYGVPCAFSSKEVREKIKNTNLEKYGVPWYCMTDECKKANGHIISSVNINFSKILDDRNIEYDFEYRIENKSYDFIINNILVDIDPSVSHNDYMNFFSGKLKENTNSDSQLLKTLVAENHGYRCIHIFDWDNWDDILDMISSRDTIYARNCNICHLDTEELDEFLVNNHLQGTCRGQDISIGLKNDDTLVMVMSFGKPRYNSNYEYELLRLCSLKDYRVIGGASKLFSYFVNTNDPRSIISYCDRSKFTGNVYLNMGMKLSYCSKPNIIWSKGRDKITSNLLRQRGYDQLFNTDYGKGTSNEQLMIENGWLPVYDCGQKVFEYQRG